MSEYEIIDEGDREGKEEERRDEQLSKDMEKESVSLGDFSISKEFIFLK